MVFSLFFTLATLSFIECEVIELTCKQIREFVDGHNARRLLVAQGKLPGHPAASVMQKLVWDDELYAKASNWASKQRGHVQSHNPITTITSGRFTTGENLYWYSTTDPAYEMRPESALDTWFNEYKHYSFGPLQMNNFLGTQGSGHYTQMVWSDSIYVGCAISKNLDNRWYSYAVVCNYGPQGNIIGSTPYKANGGTRKLICTHKNCNHPYGKKCS